MKKHILFALPLALMALTASAYEVMTVNRTAGTAAKVLIEDVAQGVFATQSGVESLKVTCTNGGALTVAVSDIAGITIGEENLQLAVTPADGASPVIYETIPTVFRVNPAATGEATEFGFGNVEAATVEEIAANGEYGVWFTVSASKVFNGEVDLAADKDSYTLKLFRYADNQIDAKWESATSGTISTSRDARGRVSFTIDATMDDGTRLRVNRPLGAVTNVDDLSGLMPAKKYANEVYMYKPDGTVEYNYTVDKVTKGSPYNGKTTYKLYCNGTGGDIYVNFTIDEAAFVNKGRFNYQNAPNGAFRVQFYRYYSGIIDLWCPDSGDSSIAYKNVGEEGEAEMTVNGDGTIEIWIDVVNKYTNYMGSGLGDGRHMVLHYRGQLN